MWASIQFYNSSTSAPKLVNGGGRIRTCAAVRRQIYSLLVLTTHPPLRSPRGDSNPLTYRLQIGCATVAPLGQLVHKYKTWFSCKSTCPCAAWCVTKPTCRQLHFSAWFGRFVMEQRLGAEPVIELTRTTL